MGSEVAAGGPQDGGAARLFHRGWVVAALLVFLVSSVLVWRQAPNPDAYRVDRTSWSEWFYYPIERNAPERLAHLSADLATVSLSSDGQRGVAVGAGGAVVTTLDGGAHWVKVASGTASRLRSVSLSSDGEHGVAVGDHGVVLATLDGGAHWVKVASGTAAGLRSVSLSSDGERGVAVGDGGVVRTLDGGAHWVKAVSGAVVGLKTISLSSDGRRGIAVGDGAVVTTLDGGANWAKSASGTVAGLMSIRLSSDGQRGVAVGDGGAVVTTLDGGAHWVTVVSGTDVGLWSVSLSSDGQRGVAVGDGAVVTTGDGGAHWSKAVSGADARLRSVWLSLDGQRGVAVGDGAAVTTLDGGAHWAKAVNGTNAGLVSVWLSSDGQRGVAVGDGGAVVTTLDGGVHWTNAVSGTDVGLWSVRLSSDGQRGVAVGDDGAVVTTLDGGAHWAAAVSGTDIWLRSVALSSDGQRGLAVGIGGIVRTLDGGAHWVKAVSGTAAALWSVSLSSDGQRGVAVGDGGVVLKTLDSGIHWAKAVSGTTAGLWSVSLSSDGQRGVAVGDGGVVVTTLDGGAHWMKAMSGTGSWFRSVWLSQDGRRGVAVGFDGAIVTTSDGGLHWAREAWPFHYRRYPAPWYFVTLLAAAALLSPALRQGRLAADKGAAAMAASDVPTTEAAQDRLNFWPLARGISRFLRNARTEPPLTMAITGDWGSGKSSLMGLICADLREHGYRPVWFNAWHHQQEEHLLAALLVAIREQGLPSTLTLGGVAFRLRLLRLRSSQYYLAAITTLAIAAALGSYLLEHDPNEWAKLWALLRAVAPAGQINWNNLLTTVTAAPVLISIGGGVSVFAALHKGLKAFGADPAVLLSKTAAKFKLKDASAQNSFRMRFSAQFREVTTALRYPIVIVIDDLDRCRAETVLDIMEAVNFLVSSGQCYVLFGMAKPRVQAALALSFTSIAKELVEFDQVTGTRDAAALPSGDDAERNRRHQYASDYLEKLINIEISVPDRRDLAVSSLLGAGDAVSVRNGAPWAQIVARWHGAARFAVLVPLVGAIFAGAWVGMTFSPQAPAASTATATVAPLPLAHVTSQTGTVGGSAVAPLHPEPKGRFMLDPGEERGIDWFWLAGAGGGLALIAGVLFAERLRRELNEVRDTDAFITALTIWTPIAASRRSSPRAIKRFGNRLRYLAMLQQGENLDVSFGARLVAQWARAVDGLGRRFGRNDAPTPEPVMVARELAIAEHRIVALGALHEVYGDQWRSVINAHSYMAQWQGEADLGKKIDAALKEYHSIDGAYWPPTDEELDSFDRSLRGVRISGDIPDIASPQRRKVNSESGSDFSFSEMGAGI